MIAATFAVQPPAPAQESAATERATERSSVIVTFRQRAVSLGEFRRAVLARQPEKVRAIVARLEQAVRADQAEFVGYVEGLGGRVTQQWWLINGCAVEIPGGRRAQLAAWGNVEQVHPDAVRHPRLVDAANNTHHGSATANGMKTGNGALIVGKGVAVAVLDTGTDTVSGSKNRPHACYYPGGNPNNNNNGGIGGSLLLQALKLNVSPSTDDLIGHGTAVAACVGANRWNARPGVGNGVAPGASIVSMNITDSVGLSQDSWIITGWQTVAGLRTALDIGVGNNSFTGSPQLDNPLQRALDSTAYNADMLICVSAGNAAGNTSESQHAYNGLAVGSVDKGFKSRSTYSAIGPLAGTQRTYPDLVAVGDGLIVPVIDDETSQTAVGGTSYAAPMVAGAAALLRQSVPDLNANEVRSLLLNSVEYRSANRNEYGLGFLKVDAAVSAALAGEVVPGSVSSNQRTASFEFKLTTAGPHRVTLAWMRNEFSSSTPPNLDLRIYDPQNRLVAADLNVANSYESTLFTANPGVAYRAEVDWTNPPLIGGELQFAIAGATNRIVPSVATIAPSSITSHAPVELQLSGRGLAAVTSVSFGANIVTDVEVIDDLRILVTPPRLLAIGTVPVQVITPYGKSPVRTLTVTGPTNPIIDGPTTVLRSSTHTFDIYAGRKWRSLLLASTSNQSSTLPGIYNLGIGSAWQAPLVTLLYLDHDVSGATSMRINFPPQLPPITIYLQVLSTDINAPQLPYPASNVLPLAIK